MKLICDTEFVKRSSVEFLRKKIAKPFNEYMNIVCVRLPGLDSLDSETNRLYK